MTDPKAMIVQLTVGELKALLVEAAAEGAAKSREETVEYLTLEQAAKLVKLDQRTLVTYVKDRGLPGIKLGNEWRFERAELLGWMRDHKHKKAG